MNAFHDSSVTPRDSRLGGYADKNGAVASGTVCGMAMGFNSPLAAAALEDELDAVAVTGSYAGGSSSVGKLKGESTVGSPFPTWSRLSDCGYASEGMSSAADGVCEWDCEAADGVWVSE